MMYRTKGLLGKIPNKINRAEKEYVMDIALSQTLMLSDDNGVYFANMERVIRNIQWNINNDSISRDFIKDQINILLNGNSNPSTIGTNLRQEEIAKSIINAIIIMARHSRPNFHFSWFACTTQNTHTINQFIKILQGKLPNNSVKNYQKNLTSAFNTLHTNANSG